MCESNAEEEGSDEAQQELQPYQPCRLRQSDATAVRRRLTLCIFLYTIGSSLLSQIFPKVSCKNIRPGSRMRFFVVGGNRERQRLGRSKSHIALLTTARASCGSNFTFKQKHTVNGSSGAQFDSTVSAVLGRNVYDI